MTQCAVWQPFPLFILPEDIKQLRYQGLVLFMKLVFLPRGLKIISIVHLSHRSDVAVPVVIFIDVMFQLDVLRSVSSVRVRKTEKSELLAGATEYV